LAVDQNKLDLMDLRYERRLKAKGYRLVAGVDEVGRGPLAGPIVAAAVILPLDVHIGGLNDSKKLTQKRREELYREIRRKAIAIGVSRIGQKRIDKINIGRANFLVMKKAVANLRILPDYLLIDGVRNRLDLPILQEGICRGDAKCASIAAASIIAKVTRDRIMLRCHHQYPEYRFDLHKGYGTRLHLQKLKEIGPIVLHRRSFSPVRQCRKLLPI
jgi:ribonuclease HII